MTPTSPGRSVLPCAGDVIAGKYRIEKVVGEGGMGVVYAAHHLILDQRVALKLMLVDAETGGETVERFVREAQAAARLRGDHVVRVTDAGALEGGMPFLVMEFLTGCDLAALLSVDGRLTAMDTADYALQALAALAQAHAAGIVHRDIKPANLFLAIREDGTNAIKVLDFGISKQQAARPRWKELTGKTVLGTPAYIAPEQLRSSKSVDPRADLWSLGVVMYELLTGRVPFDGEGPGEIFAAILETEAQPLRACRPDLPEAWEAIVARCLRRNPEQRFQTALELAGALAPLGSGRWNHLLPVIESSVRSAGARPRTDTALVDAAVAAAITSFPPPSSPSLPPPPRLRRSETLATGKTLAARVLFAPAAPSRARAAVAGACAVALLFALGVGLGRRRGASVLSRRSASATAIAAAASVASVPAASAGGAVRPPEAVAYEPPPVEAPSVSASSEGATAPGRRSDTAGPGGTTPPTVGASARASGGVTRAAPDGSGWQPNHRPAGSAAKAPGTVDSRPKFLKSWR